MINVHYCSLVSALALGIFAAVAQAFDYAPSTLSSSNTFRLLDQPKTSQSNADDVSAPLPDPGSASENLTAPPPNASNISEQTSAAGMSSASGAPMIVPGTMPGSVAEPLPTWASGAVNPTCRRPIESIYTRVDYFHWNERVDGADFVNEDGPLWTLGYERLTGEHRLRAEVFGSQVAYHADVFFDVNDIEPMSSVTNYFGVRGEYEWLFDSETWPALDFFAGIGTRLWDRDLPSGYTELDSFVLGYQEFWWTVYPYVGIETTHNPQAEIEWYGRGRVGLTAITVQNADLYPSVTLYPKPGWTTQAEGGLRGQRLYLGAFFEGMNWSQSGVKRDELQPRSTMLTIGLKTGLNF